MPMTLNTETTNAIRCAKPIVAAINALALAYEESTDILLDETDEEFDGHPLDTVRDLAHDHMETLFAELNEIIKQENIQVIFSRVNGSYILIETSLLGF
jgi:hypothetical protein